MTRLLAAHLRALRSLALEVSRQPDLAAAAALIERTCARITDAPVLVTRGGAGTPVTGSTAGTRTTLGEHAGEHWALQWPGDWTALDKILLARASARLERALAAPALRTSLARAEHVIASSFAFSRGLGVAVGAATLRQYIVETMATAAHARVGVLALYDRSEDTLHVAATHGYPAMLVEHVRVGAGEGVLGRVLSSRKPLLVRDVRELADLPTRPRYRTHSFVAVPLLAGGDVLGVASFTDREDDRPFGEADLMTVRTMAAPAALALQNDRLVGQTRELAHAATVDPLTGLFNRRHFHTRIDEEIERARRYALNLTLLLIDVDDFKRINDTLGHLAGDFVLRQVAEILKRSVRVFDVCTRYGGEEFAILMPGSSAANSLIVAERIRSRVESASREDGPLPPSVRITVSLGLAELGAGTSSQDLVGRADRALYRAKEEGKNRVKID